MSSSITRQEKDIRYMADPERWVMWPYCPVKRYTNGRDMECAYLVAVEGWYTRGGEVKLVKANMFAGFDAALPTETYSSVQAVANAGWVVD